MSRNGSSPTVSVAICLFNSARYIQETLESVFSQTVQDFEVLLVDDGSTDGCVEAIESRFQDARLRILRLPHRGLGAARRVGVAHAAGEYVAFLDHDDLWLPHKLEIQIRIAREHPEVALIFSDCLFIDASGKDIGRLSQRHDYESIDLSGSNGFRELLFHGCFIDVSTVLARTVALRRSGNFDPRYSYVEDYDMWLRIARGHKLFHVAEPLAKRRIHAEQFTQTHPSIALSEQVHLLRPFMKRPSSPVDVRTAIRDYLLGQHRECIQRLLAQRRPAAAAFTALGMLRLPDGLLRSWLHLLSLTPLWPAIQWSRHRSRSVYRRLDLRRRASAANHVWIDGSPLGEARTGYFNLLVELLRTLLRQGETKWIVHVVAPASGLAPLRERLGQEAAGLRLHRLRLSFFHWTAVHRFLTHWSTSLLLALLLFAMVSLGTQLHSRALLFAGLFLGLVHAAFLVDGMVAAVRSELGPPAGPVLLRLLRLICRAAAAPHGMRARHGTVEVLVWRGRFRYAGSHKIALIQDLTTRIHPELHTEGNVSEFEDYLRYALRHADTVCTLSESSKKDIIELLDVFPESVEVIPVPVHPMYVEPAFSRGFMELYGIGGPYLLCVGTLEPRKNLRRLVKAFERLATEPEAREHILVLAGPRGWDEGFDRFLVESDAYRRILRTGFVELEHLPSLYHHAAAVVYPSVYEGFGLPVLEAMCCSAIVLASRVSSLPDVLGEGGIDFDPYRTEDLAAAMLRALRLGPEEASAYRRRCRSRAEALLAEGSKRPPLPGLE